MCISIFYVVSILAKEPSNIAPSQLTPMFIMSNQHPTGHSWSLSAGNPPTFGALPSAPVGGFVNTLSGAAYAPVDAGAPVTAARFANAPVAPVPAPTGGFAMTNPYIAPPGTAYTPLVLGPGNCCKLCQRADRTGHGAYGRLYN